MTGAATGGTTTRERREVDTAELRESILQGITAKNPTVEALRRGDQAALRDLSARVGLDRGVRYSKYSIRAFCLAGVAAHFLFYPAK